MIIVARQHKGPEFRRVTDKQNPPFIASCGNSGGHKLAVGYALIGHQSAEISDCNGRPAKGSGKRVGTQNLAIAAWLPVEAH